MNPFLISLFVVIAIVLIGMVGLRISPRPFVMPKLEIEPGDKLPLPSGLPEPVTRFYRSLYGNEIPVIKTVTITGRGRIRPFGIWLPARFLFVHQAGRHYRHYFETTFFGLPFLRVNEGILDGRSFFESPMGTYHDDDNTNQGAQLALWAEAGWFPALWVTDPRAHWTAVDDQTALLSVPGDDGDETFVVRFDPQTGKIDLMEAMRYRRPGDKHKILWLTGISQDGRVGYVTWLDEGRPWAEFIPDQILFNGSIAEYLRQRGI